MSDQATAISASYRSPARLAGDVAARSQQHPATKLAGDLRKIAYLVSEYPKVSHSFIRREIAALEKRGWSVTRLSIRGWSADLVDPADIRERSITEFVLRGGMLPLAAAAMKLMIFRPARFLKALAMSLRMTRQSDKPAVWHLVYLAEASWIASRLINQGITHLHAHFGTNPAEVAMLAGQLAGIDFSFTVHGPEEFDRARNIHLQEKIARAKTVVAISSFTRSQLLRTADLRDWDKIRIVHCGIDQLFQVPASAFPSLRRRLVCVGRLCEQKGQLLLLEAAALLLKQECPFDLVLVGDGEHRAAVEERIAEYGLQDHVRITGWATAAQVKEEILAARALIMPSFAEGLPVVIMEAMALGRPVLATYVAGIPELVMDGKNGWLFPAGSVDEMAAAMRACLEAGEEELRVLGESSRIQARERHDIDREAAKLDALFRTVMGA
jgi:colanic acid/amylovoran biosynthesis glycosyltransferase